jgi:hypothetical protein
MYTGRKVTSLLRPLTVSVLLLLGAAPAAGFACQLACLHATDDTQAQAHHPHHGRDATQPAATQVSSPSMAADEAACSHASTVEPLVVVATTQLHAPVAILLANTFAMNPDALMATHLPERLRSPPGPRSTASRLPLRI